MQTEFQFNVVSSQNPVEFVLCSLFAIRIDMQASQELDQPHEPAAAGNIEVMQIENADQPMDAETDAASQQLAALQAMPELMEKVL